ncbi:Hsp70 family protein [Micromonospora sp. WMMD812]|uniref:Hsp70 family protein n=1 Tax=Micromonospora sp. WMMD812 TaxID=3015152 RepID=UPI00248A96BB|nr:Hsp70 family protein [Micromonospora sp. WMMD812]WBB69203.1 Hsp70 family protein [Micromonospora sp. WMMD812]
MDRGPCTVLREPVAVVRGHLHLSLPRRLIVNLFAYTRMSAPGQPTEKDSHHPCTKDHGERITVDVASPSPARLPLMPNGGVTASIDLSSTAIAVTVSREGARVPILIDGRLVMPPGVAISPAGQLYAGLDSTAARSLPADHRFIDDPTDLLGKPAHPSGPGHPDPVDLLAAVLRHVGYHAANQVGQPATELTVTVPPSWGPRRRGQVSEAATRAGLPSPALVTAPAALAAYAASLGVTMPEGSCVLVCQADRHPATLTVLQAVGDGYRELATHQLDDIPDLDHLITQRVVHAATADNDALRTAIRQPANDNAEGHIALLESVRAARHLLVDQDRAPILLPAPRQPTVITRDDITNAAQPLLDQIPRAVTELLDAADVDKAHLAAVVLRPAHALPALTDQLAQATGAAPALIDQPHALADGALALTAAHQPRPRAAATRLPRIRLRISDLTGALLIGASSLTLLLQAVLTADITTVNTWVVGARTSLPQLGTAGALAMLTAFAVAHLAPTTWLAGAPTASTPEPTTGNLIRRGYLAAAVGGAVTATLYGLATGTAVEFDYTPYLKWTLGAALPLATCAALIAATAPRIPADALPSWLARTRPAITYTLIAAAGIFLMRAALTLTTPIHTNNTAGIAGSLGAALLGAATALTASRSRAIRTITAPGLAIGYALVFSYDTSSALIVGYLVALSWWGIRLTAHTLRLAFPTVGTALHRLVDRSNG